MKDTHHNFVSLLSKYSKKKGSKTFSLIWGFEASKFSPFQKLLLKVKSPLLITLTSLDLIVGTPSSVRISFTTTP